MRPEPDGRIPLRALRRGDRRADGARLLHRDLVPHGLSARRRRGRRARARARRARASPTATRRSARSRSTSRALGVDFLTAGTVKYLLALRGPRVHVRAPRPARAAPADADRLVRRRGHLRHGHRGLLAGVRPRDASTPARRRCRTSTPGSPAWALVERPACRRSRRTCAVSSSVSSPGSTSSARRWRRRAGRASTARSSASPRPTRTRSSRRSAPSGSSPPSRDANLRISLHLYNVEEDVDRILEALARNRALLA